MKKAKKKDDTFFILDCLYTRSDYRWMLEIDTDKLSSYTVYLWLSMSQDYNVLEALRKIDKYMFILSDFEQLLLLHATIPKSKKAPFNRYVKSHKDTDDLDFLYELIQDALDYSDREFSYVKQYIEPEIKKDLKKWFQAFAVEEKTYKKFGLSFLNEPVEKKVVSVERFEW